MRWPFCWSKAFSLGLSFDRDSAAFKNARGEPRDKRWIEEGAKAQLIALGLVQARNHATSPMVLLPHALAEWAQNLAGLHHWDAGLPGVCNAAHAYGTFNAQPAFKLLSGWNR